MGCGTCLRIWLSIFEELRGTSRILDLAFESLDLWVQVHNLPLSCMNQECVEVIGNHIGTFKEVSGGENGECWGRYLRIRISINISKPLKRLVGLCLVEGESPELLLLQYERLPTFCYRCGFLGHSFRECLLDALYDENGKETLSYGAWLSVSTGYTRSGGSPARL